ncbi:hypothetical protein L1987_22607 [Smallanthus sonchifolius]|uniref:Uncharacterized protein n=1 Tax=Smallanthus sonchifolius TaxID=185202 RepID=A0ACB9IEK9_9ASTR|nr:hypothetical protein L1987_22607 [Smallanthus sonchifolius]
MMPNSKINMVESKNNTANKSNAADSKTNNSSTTGKHSNVDLKHNNSVVTKNSNSDTKNSNSDAKNNSDSKTNADTSAQGDGGGGTLSPHGAAQPSKNEHSLNGNKVYKSGPLFLSSKAAKSGLAGPPGRKGVIASLKILKGHSLSLFVNVQNAAPQKGGEANLTLGGIDLNSSGSVVVKADKKLLTVQFPDGRDGRTFTLKAETTEDLNEWKAALDEALANAPRASPKAGSTGTLKNEKGDTTDGSPEQSKDKSPGKPMVLGRPLLLALEDIDGTPSFLEKALRYVEDYGVKVEGILRQAADVEDVERRIREYEQGKLEFNEDEDAHVIGDCIKYVLRELPSSPVPASCCNALLDAYSRILIMMEAVAENKNVNRMSVSAVAACMAPLLLRPILACECNLDSQFNMGGDGSAQLMQAAAAANHAQAIEGDILSDLYSDSEELESGSEDLSEDDYDDGEYTSEDSEHASTSSHSGGDSDSYQKNTEGPGTIRSHTIAHKATDDVEANKKLKSSSHARSVSQVSDSVSNRINDHSTRKTVEHVGRPENDNVQLSTKRELTDNIQRSSTSADSHANTKYITFQETDAKKKSSNVEEKEHEATKEESKAKTEAADLLSKKKDLETRRLQLKQEVARLEEQLQKELELRKKLETGIKISQQALFSQFSTNEKIKADLDDFSQAESDVSSLNQKIDDLELQSSNPGKVKDDHEATITSQESKETNSSKDMMKRSSTSKPKRLNSKNEKVNSNTWIHTWTGEDDRTNNLQMHRRGKSESLSTDKQRDHIQTPSCLHHCKDTISLSTSQLFPPPSMVAPASFPDNLTREQYVYMAKLAEQAERYEEMVKFMEKLVVGLTPASELTVEERNLLSVAYKNVIGSLRAAWRIVSSIEQKEESRKNDDHVVLVKDYRSKVEDELSVVCSGILKILEANLVPSASTAESKVFYLKMKGDYHRYLAEFKVGDERKESAEQTMNSYKAAQDIAEADLAPTHPIRLGLALNFSVFYYEILNSADKACNMAKQAFEDAIAELDTLGEDSYKDSTLIMQLLRDNLTLWTSDAQEQDEP